MIDTIAGAVLLKLSNNCNYSDGRTYEYGKIRIVTIILSEHTYLPTTFFEITDDYK